MAIFVESKMRPSHLMLVYCMLATAFCFYFLHIAKRNSISYQETIHQILYNLSEHSREFPQKIWQTSRFGPAAIEEEDRSCVQSWVKLNRRHRYEIITRETSDTYVRERFSHRPDIQQTFQNIQNPILRADFIRYLLLFGDGGVYSDIDTICQVPIADWTPMEYRDATNLVIGIEFDALGDIPWVDWTSDLQFATWAILAKPGHLIMELAVDRVLEGVQTLAKQQDTVISKIKPTYRDILDTTGPAMFTRAVFEGLNHALGGNNFDWKNLTGLTEPRLVADVLILPISSFGSGQSHSNSGRPDADTALVQHLFKGTWKTGDLEQEVAGHAALAAANLAKIQEQQRLATGSSALDVQQPQRAYAGTSGNQRAWVDDDYDGAEQIVLTG